MTYDQNYFEAGVENGVSGYQNYRWIPEISFPMAHHLINQNKLTFNHKIIDFGCAKGFLLKAFYLMGYNNIKGYDISEYAINFADPVIKSRLNLISSIDDFTKKIDDNFDLCILKDVLEHIEVSNLEILLKALSKLGNRVFIAVPLGIDDISNKFIIPAMHNDVTHITIKSKPYWESLITNCGWRITNSSFTYPGMKSNWTNKFPQGNLFITASSI